METTRVKINIMTGEVEFEGSEEFVQNQMDNLDAIIQLVSSRVSQERSNTYSRYDNEDFETEEETHLGDSGEASNNGDTLVVSGSFGEWMHKFKDSINDLEKALVTAYYVQKQSDKNDFKTLDVTKSLKDHGIKLSNPSQSLKKLDDKKYLFQTRKEGPKIRFMRVSTDGMAHLKALLR